MKKNMKKFVIAIILVSLCLGTLNTTISAHSYGASIGPVTDVLRTLFDKATGTYLIWAYTAYNPSTAPYSAASTCGLGTPTILHTGTLNKTSAGNGWNVQYETPATLDIFTYWPYMYVGTISA